MGSLLFDFNHALSVGLTRTAKPILLWLLILLLGLRPQSGHAQTAPVSQPGLKASYFGGTTLSGTPLSRVTVPNIDFEWGIGSPEAGMPVDDWSARYEGMIEAPYSGEIEFHTLSDDGIRLWVDGQQIINNWTEHAQTLNTGRITLVQGQKVPIVCEFYERAGGATARLQWNYSGENPFVVPSSALSSVADPAFPPGTTADRTGPQVTIATPANGSASNKHHWHGQRSCRSNGRECHRYCQRRNLPQHKYSWLWQVMGWHSVGKFRLQATRYIGISQCGGIAHLDLHRHLAFCDAERALRCRCPIP